MQDLQNATAIDQNKKGNKMLEVTFARQAVQRAEDARLVTLRRQAAERQLNAENAKRDAQTQAPAIATCRRSRRNSTRSVRESAQAQADADRARAEAAAAEAQARAAAANKSAQDANAVREKLRSQLNSVLATSESARGLIVNMSDVLFDTGKYTLKPNTQISLAKVSGILQAYPGLKLQVEGYTDSVGSDEYNQKLSENRADAGRDFLVTQGVSQTISLPRDTGRPSLLRTTTRRRAARRTGEFSWWCRAMQLVCNRAAPAAAAAVAPT